MNIDRKPKHSSDLQPVTKDNVIVTGAAGGIGSGIVDRLTNDGWGVIALDLDETGLKDLETRIASTRLSTQQLDISDPDAVEELASTLKNDGISVSGLVNAAGILENPASILNVDVFEHRRIWDVNYFGALYGTKWFGELIKRNGGGSIVNITSINELRPLPLHAYAPAKVALGALTKLSAGELGASSIRVNSVAPGFTRTPGIERKLASGERNERALTDSSAMRRLVEVEEVAAVVSFLMSDDAKGVTGVSIPVDAGWLTTSHWMNFGNSLT